MEEEGRRERRRDEDEEEGRDGGKREVCLVRSRWAAAKTEKQLEATLSRDE